MMAYPNELFSTVRLRTGGMTGDGRAKAVYFDSTTTHEVGQLALSNLAYADSDRQYKTWASLTHSRSASGCPPAKYRDLGPSKTDRCSATLLNNLSPFTSFTQLCCASQDRIMALVGSWSRA